MELNRRKLTCITYRNILMSIFKNQNIIYSYYNEQEMGMIDGDNFI